MADFASQAVICHMLQEAFPGDAIIAEEDSADLRADAQAGVRRIVVEHVGGSVGRELDEATVLSWIDHGRPAGASVPNRFWTLDPIDGTKGFLRGEQYAVALALIEGGQVVLGALACPNLPADEGAGVLLVGVRGEGSYMLPLGGSGDRGRPVRVSSTVDPRLTRFCESIEGGHSDHGQSARIAASLGITAGALRMDSQAKYAAVARGEAEVYLRLPTSAEYREKIWDHAAGALIVEEAGGQVSDIEGRRLDFGHPPTLAANRGVVATNGGLHRAVLGAMEMHG